MTQKYCGICRRLHWYQATAEYDAPRRESASDFWLAFVTWALIVAAYIAGAYALAGMAS